MALRAPPVGTLTTALTNPDDIDAWHQRGKEQRRQRDEQLERERKQQAQWLAQERERMAATDGNGRGW